MFQNQLLKIDLGSYLQNITVVHIISIMWGKSIWALFHFKLKMVFVFLNS